MHVIGVDSTFTYQVCSPKSVYLLSFVMSSNPRMGDGLKFRQLWQFRRNENDFDSSSYDSKSNSVDEPVLKEHNLVSGLIDNDETSNTSRLQQNHKHYPGFEDLIEIEKGKEKKIKRTKRNNLANSKLKRDSNEEVNRKKSRTRAYDPAVLDDVKSFTESLLEDLKAMTENLFTWMREEINKLVADDIAPRKRRKGVSEGKKVQSQHQESCGKKIKVQHQKNFGKNPKFQHQNNIEESTRKQHLNSNGTIIHMRQQNNVEEDIEVQHQNNHEKGNQVQHQNNFKSGMKATRCNGESPERFVKTTKADDANNHRQALDDQFDYGKATRSISSLAKEKRQRLALTANLKFQSSSSDQNVEVQHPKTVVLAIRAQNCNNETAETSVGSKKTADSNKVYQEPEERPGCSQAMESMASYEKEKAKRSRVPVEQNLSPNPSDQVPSSMYLTLPTVLTKPPDLNCKIDNSLCDYIQPRVSGNKTSVNLNRPNQMLDLSTHWGYLPSIEPQQRRGDTAQTASRNTSHLDQNGVPSSSTGTAFPLPLNQVISSGFGIPGRLCSENPQENCNTLGVRMNGGAVTFSRRNYSLSDHLVAYNFRGHPNYNADSTLMPYQVPSIRDGDLFPN